MKQLDYCQYSYNFGLFGKGWKDIAEFYSLLEIILILKRNYSIYTENQINIYNNTHGLGMHSKVFEIMANGGFSLTTITKNSLEAELMNVLMKTSTM